MTSWDLAVGLSLALCVCPALDAQLRHDFEDVPIEPLVFQPPKPERHLIRPGVSVLYLEDRTLPLVSVFARFSGGPSSFGRERLAASTAIPQLLRSGGTHTLSADSVDRAMEFYAAETTFGGGGRSSFASLNTLTEHLSPVLEMWFSLLREPGFDRGIVEVWRGRELEAARRKKDNPGSLAVAQFNRLMYGDHPIGWDIGPDDLGPESLSPEALSDVHGRVFCPENLTLGVSGDVSWQEIRPLLEKALEGWPSCPEPLQDPPRVEFGTSPGVFLIGKDLAQSTVILGAPSRVRLADDEEYFSSRIGNSILGASGFSSRLVTRVRTESGYAYSASSVWTTPMRSEGLLGAVTQTKAESTVAAIRLIREVMEEMADRPPPESEVRDAIDRVVNGFVFNFQPAQVVSRQMLYLSQDLPLDWLTRYVDGIQRVTSAGVLRVMEQNVDPDRLVILVLGNPDAFDEPLESLGPVTEIVLPDPG